MKPKAVMILPKEICPAVEFAFPREALLGEIALTIGALHALGVPGPVQDIQQEAVQNGPLAAGALHHGRRLPNGTARGPHGGDSRRRSG